MNRYEVMFTPGAEANLDSILFYIAADNPLRAITFVEELRQKAVEFLSYTPNGGSSTGRHRYIVIGNYVVVYLVDEEMLQVRILLVTEGHRHWRRMVDELD